MSNQDFITQHYDAFMELAKAMHDNDRKYIVFGTEYGEIHINIFPNIEDEV